MNSKNHRTSEWLKKNGVDIKTKVIRVGEKHDPGLGVVYYIIASWTDQDGNIFEFESEDTQDMRVKDLEEVYVKIDPENPAYYLFTI